MIRSSLVKSACVAIALVGFSAPQAGAIELQGSNPSAPLNDGLISKAFVAHRGVTAVGPRGGVYHRGGTRLAAIVAAHTGGAYGAESIAARGLPRRIWRLGAAELVSLGCGRRDRGRRCDRRLGHGSGRCLRGPAASAGTVLVLHRPELSAGVLGRLPVDIRVFSLSTLGRPFATQATGRPIALRDARPAVGKPSRLT